MNSHKQLLAIFFCCLFACLGMVPFFSFVFTLSEKPSTRYQQVSLYMETIPVNSVSQEILTMAKAETVKAKFAGRERSDFAKVSKSAVKTFAKAGGNVRFFSRPFSFADIGNVLSKDVFASSGMLPGITAGFDTAGQNREKLVEKYPVRSRTGTVEEKNIEDTLKEKQPVSYAMNLMSPDSVNTAFIPKLDKKAPKFAEKCKVLTSNEDKPVWAVTLLKF